MLELSKPINGASFTAAGITGTESKFGYDAIEQRGKRRVARQYHTSEDLILDQNRRTQLTANSRDLARNFSIAGWMVRRHLDYVTSFDFHCRTPDKVFNEAVELYVEQWSRRWNFDAAGRHNRARFIRLAEIRRVVDGDIGIHKLANGTLQGIESDRIRNPAGVTGTDEWINGVKLAPSGRARAYSIWKRTKQGMVFERDIPASRMELLGYFDRFDQVRGVSPLAAALNPLRDVYENFDLALVKAKVSQLFAMVFTRDSTDSMGDVQITDESEEGDGQPRYEIDFGRGPVKLELDPGDKAEFLNTNHPSSEFQQFTELVIQVALKALDIPFSFYNESFTNFFGSRAAWLHYQRSCKAKIADLEELLDDLTAWRMQLAILDGELQLPRGMNLSEVWWEWVPTGMPWWDPAKEINGDLLAIGAGLDNPQRITKERGRGDFYDNVDRIAEAIAYARDKGVPLSFMSQLMEESEPQE